MIVVSDTSSINYLTLMGLHELLPALFGEVVIPPTVARELAAGATIHPAIGATLKSEWLLVRNLGGTGLPEDAPQLPRRADCSTHRPADRGFGISRQSKDHQQRAQVRRRIDP